MLAALRDDAIRPVGISEHLEGFSDGAAVSQYAIKEIEAEQFKHALERVRRWVMLQSILCRGVDEESGVVHSALGTTQDGTQRALDREALGAAGMNRIRELLSNQSSLFPTSTCPPRQVMRIVQALADPEYGTNRPKTNNAGRARCSISYTDLSFVG